MTAHQSSPQGLVAPHEQGSQGMKKRDQTQSLCLVVCLELFRQMNRYFQATPTRQQGHGVFVTVFSPHRMV